MIYFNRHPGFRRDDEMDFKALHSAAIML